MTVDLLSARLKAAKRELTALKTAHRRGLGLVRIYKTEHFYSDDNIDWPESYRGTMTLEFSRNFAPNPFVYILSTDTGEAPWYNYTKSIDVSGIVFSQDGYTATVSCDIFYGYGDIFNRAVIYSTAPILSVTTSWRIKDE